MTGWGSVANPTRAGHNGHGQLQGQQALTGASVAAEQRDVVFRHHGGTRQSTDHFAHRRRLEIYTIGRKTRN